MSKRKQETQGGAAGGCCTGGGCEKQVPVHWGVLLNDAPFAEERMSGEGAEEETRQERGREEGSSNKEGDMGGGTRAEAEQAATSEEGGQEDINKLSKNSDSRTSIISGNDQMRDGGEWEEGEAKEEARLCGGCNSLGTLSAFSQTQWEKKDAWSREYARRCTRCEQNGEMEEDGGNDKAYSAAGGRRAARARKPLLPVETKEERCLMRRIDQVLCMTGCECGNALPANTGGGGGNSGGKARAVHGEGLQEGSSGVWSTDVIEAEEIITCFGGAATVKGAREVQELTKALKALGEAGGKGCQYSLSGNLAGEDTFSPTEVWVIPPPDVMCLQETNPGPRLEKALEKRGPPGIGHLANHTCCTYHRNAVLELRWVSEDKQLATAVVVADKRILPGERILVHYAPEGDAFQNWAQTFACTCCKCRGACGGADSKGPEDFVNFINSTAALEPEWDTGGSRERKVALGTRVRVKIPEGDMVGNVIGWEKRRAVIQGVCIKGNDGSVIDIEEREKEQTAMRVEVDEKDCEIIDDWLQWGDREITMGALLRVRHRERAAHQEDYMEDSVLMAMLRWGLHGASETAGLRAQVHNDWLVDSFTFKKVQEAWQAVERNPGPLVSLLRSLGHKEVYRQMKGTELQVNPAFHRNICVPIHLENGNHWLMAGIDTRARKLKLLDCSKAFGKAWRGRIHALLWVWFLASVRRVREEHGDNVKEPIWSIDLSQVCLSDLRLLPGFHSENMKELTKMQTERTGTIAGARKVLGTDNISQLALLNIELRWGGEAEDDHWQWSASIEEVPQQRRGSDCAVFTLLYAAFKVRGWDMGHLKNLNPRAARRWILHTLLKEGVWKRHWTCTACGEDTVREVTPVRGTEGESLFRCRSAKGQECKNRQEKREAAKTVTQGRVQGTTSGEGSSEKEKENPEGAAGKRARRSRGSTAGPGREPEETQMATKLKQESPDAMGPEGVSQDDVTMVEREGEKGPYRQESRQQEHGGRENEDGTGEKGLHRQTSIAGAAGKQPERRSKEEKTGSAESKGVKGEASRGPKDGGHFSKQIFKVREDSESTYKGDVECETCGLWGASLKVDRDEDNYVCDKVCRQRWRLREVVKSLEKRKREGDSKEKSSEKSPPPLPRPKECEACGSSGAQHLCGRCGDVWYCKEECQQQHWSTHREQCKPGPWCAVCGSMVQKDWCTECNQVAYCSPECREQDASHHSTVCEHDTTEQSSEGPSRRKPRAREQGYVARPEKVEEQVRVLRQHRTRGGQRSTSDAPGGQGVEDNQGKHREALLRVLTNAQRADEQTEDEEEASQRSGERLERDLCSAEEALRQILGPAAATLPQMDLSNDRLWARTRLRPVLRRLCTRRVDRLLAKEEHKDGVRVSFQGIPADTRQQAIEYLQEAGICLLQDQVPQAKFSIHTKRGAARRTSVMCGMVEVSEALKSVWCGVTKVGGRQIICESKHGNEEEGEEERGVAVLTPAHNYSSDFLRCWVKMWRLMELTDLEVRELVVWSAQSSLPGWRIDEVQIWSPGAPRALHEAWDGEGAMQGQIRLRGDRINPEECNSHLLGNLHAIDGKASFDARRDDRANHIPRGAARGQCKASVTLGLPGEGTGERAENHHLPQGMGAELGAAPEWARRGGVMAKWEPLAEGSDWEANSAACIRFRQVRETAEGMQEEPSRVQIRERLVTMVNEIQRVCRLSDEEFGVTEVCYAAFTNSEGVRQGMVALQKRRRDLLENDILVGAILGFYMGNDIQNLTTKGYKWCPILGRLGKTACGISSITAAHTWGGRTRRQLVMGTRKAGASTWLMKDAKESTVRSILSLVGGHGEGKEKLLAKLKVTPWTRNKMVMSRQEGTGAQKQDTETKRKASPLAEKKKGEGGEERVEERHGFLAAIEGWETHWEEGPRGEEQKTTGPDRGSGGGLGKRLRAMKREGLREQGDAVGARAVTGDWVPGVGLEREMMRAEAQMKLGEAAREGTLDTFFQGLRERGHVGLANEGARVWTCVQEPSEGEASGTLYRKARAWRKWLDWEVRMRRPLAQSNVITWNLGPLGYEASKEELRRTLQEGKAVVMIQELGFPRGARRRVKRELNDLHPEYHCILEAGKEALTSDCWRERDEGKMSKWHSRKQLAVATFFHVGVFKSIQRLEWDTEGSTRKLRHMTRGRVLFVDAVTHGGKKLRTFNVHQATSGDIDLQKMILQIVKKIIVDSKNQMIVLGGDLNANAGGERIGYAKSNEDRMQRVDALLTSFIKETGGRLISPSTVSWEQRAGQKGARLDHVVCWNVPLGRSACEMGLEWEKMGQVEPTGALMITNERLSKHLEKSTSLTMEEGRAVGMSDISAQSAIRVGQDFFQPVVRGRVDWTGQQQHDHAKLSVEIATEVLTFERGIQRGPKTGKCRIKLSDWKKIAPDLNASMQGGAKERTRQVRGGYMDAGDAVRATTQGRTGKAREMHQPAVRARETRQRRGEHRNKEQILLWRDVSRAEAALREGLNQDRVTRAQELCLQDIGWHAERSLTTSDKLTVTHSSHWKSLLEERVRVNKETIRLLTQKQVTDSRIEMDRRAKKAFENEHKGPSKFAGKRVGNRQPELLRWAVPVGFQWVVEGDQLEEAQWEARVQMLRKVCPGAEVTMDGDNVCVAVMQVKEQQMEQALEWAKRASVSWRAGHAEHDREELLQEIKSEIDRRRIRPNDGADMQELVKEVARKMAGSITRQESSASIGQEGLRGEDELRWCAWGDRAQEDMHRWLKHLRTPGLRPFPWCLKWDENALTITHDPSGWSARWDVESDKWLSPDEGGRSREDMGGATGEEADELRGLPGARSSQRARRSLHKAKAREELTPFGTVRFFSEGGTARHRTCQGNTVVVTATVKKLSQVDALLQESNKWEGLPINRQVLLQEGPWTGENMAIAWELYFQAQGLAPHAWCGTEGCSRRKPLVLVVPTTDGERCQEKERQKTAAPEETGSEGGRRALGGFCTGCWKRVGLREGKDTVASTEFMRLKGIFKDAKKIDPRARLRGHVTRDEFQKFVDNFLKNNKSPGPDGITNECVKTMSSEELEVLRAWVNEILSKDEARLMTIEEMNGTISLLHKGGDTDDRPRDWRPVVLLNCTNQIVMHILNSRLREVVERAGILEPGQTGGRQGRSTDINLAKLEWVTREAIRQKKRVFRVDVDFTNAFNAMSQAALWEIMEAYGIPDVDLLKGLYTNSTVRLAPNDGSSATITFDTGVAQGSALSPLLFLIFMNALLGLLTAQGKQLGISHGLSSGGSPRGGGGRGGTTAGHAVGQFNSMGFVDDLSLFAQTLQGAQALLDTIQDFEEWSGLRVNQKKTCLMVIEDSTKISPPGTELKYQGYPIRKSESAAAVRYLGLWGTAAGDMAETKKRILEKTKEARDMIEHHPLHPEQAVELFVSVGVGAFRYSAALVAWTAEEMQYLETLWVQAYKRAWFLPLSTASDIFTLPKTAGGLEYPRPIGIMAQELCRHLQRCVKQDDVAKQIATWEMKQTLEKWACSSIQDLQQEMRLWKWNQALENKWTRAAKSMQLLDLGFNWAPDRAEEKGEDRERTSWSSATRELRRLRRRIETIGGGKASWERGIWDMEKEQWKLLWEGEAAFWKIVPKLISAGFSAAEDMAQSKHSAAGKVYKIPTLTRVNAEEGTQTVRILLAKGLEGVDEKTRGTVQRWLDMVDWRGARVGQSALSMRKSVGWYLEREGNGVRNNHPARKWVEDQEARMVGEHASRTPGAVRECAEDLGRVMNQRMGEDDTSGDYLLLQKDMARILNPSKRPEIAVKCIIRLAKRGGCSWARIRNLMSIIGDKLPPGWGKEWRELVDETANATMSDLTQMATAFVARREEVCPECQVRMTAECRGCDMKWCKRCSAPEHGCGVCDKDGNAEEVAGRERSEAEMRQGHLSEGRRAETTRGRRIVNMHQLGSRFVKEVTDVRRGPSTGDETGGPGEELQFLATIRGWEEGEPAQRKEALMQMGTVGLQVALQRAAGSDIFLIPQQHFPQETPEDHEGGWWYCVKGVARCRKCASCEIPKEQQAYEGTEWRKKRPAKCMQCDEKHQEARMPTQGGGQRKVTTPKRRKRKKEAEGMKERRVQPKREGQARRGCLADRDRSESEGDLQEEEQEDEAQTHVIMSPANPRYVGRGDDTSGGEIVYTIGEMRDLLHGQPDRGQMWLSTNQMGWSLTPEPGELLNERDVMEGKVTARMLAPVISEYIRGLGDTDFMSPSQERQDIISEAWELDQIWGKWENEGSEREGAKEGQQEKLGDGDSIRHQVAKAMLRQQREWEPPSHSQTMTDPQVLPSGQVQPLVGRDFFLDESIPRNANGDGYVAVTELSMPWKETKGAEVTTYQGVTSCMEPDQQWMIMGSTWSFLSKHAKRTGKDMRAFIREEVNYQEQIEADGYRSPSWRILRALQKVYEAEQLQGESAVTAPPFFRSAGRGERVFWGREQGPTVFVWESLDAEGRKRCEEVTRSTRNWVVWSRTNPRRGRDETRAYTMVGKALFEGKARPANSEGEADLEGESSEEEREEAQENREETGGRANRQKGWWQRGAIETNRHSVNMTAWVHKDGGTINQEKLTGIQQAWDCEEMKDECTVRLDGPERDYWLGSEIGRLGGYEFQGAVYGIDGANQGGKMGAGCCRLGKPDEDQSARVGREEEGTSSNRPELGGVALALRKAGVEKDALILCDNESVLKVIKKWIGQGGKATLTKAPDADILREILARLRARIEAGRATFFVKVKSHRGEAMNERADGSAEEGRVRPEEEKKWDQRTDRMTFEVKTGEATKLSVWTDSVRNAFRKQAGKAKLLEAYDKAAKHWTERVWYCRNQRWMQATKAGKLAARAGNFKEEETWGKECFERLEQEDLGKPATDTWSTDFLVREGVGREELGSWLKNKVIPWKRRRRLIQTVTNTFPCGAWLHKIGYRATAGCRLCLRIREERGENSQEAIQAESIGHIQSAGCLGQSEVVTAAHNRCIRDLLRDIQTHRKKSSGLTMLTLESEQTIGKLWEQEECGGICPKQELWEAAKETEMSIPLQKQEDEGPATEQDYEERFWRRRLDGIALDRTGRKCYPIEFKRKRDQRRTYEEQATEVAEKQYESLLTGLQAVGKQRGWEIKQIIFVGGTCGSVGEDVFNQNMKLLEVVESKWSAIRQKLARRLLEEHDKVLRSYFAQIYGGESQVGGRQGPEGKGPGREHLGLNVYA